MASLPCLNDALKQFYTPAITEWLNQDIEDSMIKGPPVPASWYEERGLPLPWVYVPPPWYKRQWRTLRANVKYEWRERLGFWIAGHRREDW